MSLIDAFISFFHVFGGIMWIGGAVILRVIVNPSLEKIDPYHGAKASEEMEKNLGKYFGIGLGLLVVTGLLKIYNLFSNNVNLTDSYLILLLAIILLFLIINILSSYVVFTIVSKFPEVAPKPGENPNETYVSLQKRGRFFNNIELGLIFILLFLMMLLINL